MQNKPTAEPAGADQDIEDLGLVDGLAQLSFLVQGALGKVAAEHGLSVVQLRLLGVLRDRTPGMQELAHHLGLDKSSMTGLVDRAERRDLVRRTPAAHDRRSFLVSITPAGQQLARQCEALASRRILDLTAHLTEAQRGHLALLASALVNHHTTI
ncbi:MarR family winged helix-turn-helix transcriptional regulator [Streptomyces fuscichromogenes]|uniref:MarR family transcriptional regulator n=1 Tax=Streptomyces fuscichromogenes TaxID=1324013 RepID=A0A917XBK6_9ACTN|nr:MarR family transcriptional regulator [Streptomyces fuscichromogenes]GGN04589.1 MarR family transcriptional regulator [Streptomyces fuscichromogenes]